MVATSLADVTTGTVSVVAAAAVGFLWGLVTTGASVVATGTVSVVAAAVGFF